MDYILTGFITESGYRVFAFECMSKERVRTHYRVRVDIALIRKYGIHVQDLPLLCRGLLDRRLEDEEPRALTYTESDMRIHADVLALRHAEAQKKKTPRRPPSENVGAAWRGPQP